MKEFSFLNNNLQMEQILNANAQENEYNDFMINTYLMIDFHYRIYTTFYSPYFALLYLLLISVSKCS